MTVGVFVLLVLLSIALFMGVPVLIAVKRGKDPVDAAFFAFFLGALLWGLIAIIVQTWDMPV